MELERDCGCFGGLQPSPEEGASGHEEEGGGGQAGAAQQHGEGEGFGNQGQSCASAAETHPPAGIRTPLLQVKALRNETLHMLMLKQYYKTHRHSLELSN